MKQTNRTRRGPALVLCLIVPLKITQASQEAANLSRQRYEGGATDFLSVLDAQRTLLEAQDRLAASQTRTVTAFVAVHKALAGGLPVAGPKR